MSGMPWRDLIRTAAEIGVKPGEFWDVSVKEWRMLIASGREGPAMGRRDLDRLTSRYPDEEIDHG
jgi:uncharacterized phage protein (TIGR02216 family)